MSGVWHNWYLVLGSLLLTGAAVKLVDDYLDGDYDLCQGKRTLAVKLGRATLPYSLLFLLFGMYLDPPVGLSVFLGSYAVGMMNNLGEQLPTRLPAWGETVLACIASALLVGWALALWGLAMMAAVDWIDDLMDRVGDRAGGQRNIAVKIGSVETMFLVLVALCVAIVTRADLTVWCFIAVVLLSAFAEVSTTSFWDGLDHDEGADI